MKKLFLFAFFLIFLAFNVNAIAEFTYRFNVNNVEIGAYNCLDSGCYTVGPFSGSFPDGKTTANGRIRIRYPSSLATPYGYAVYYVSNGYVPMEYKTTWHTFGYPGIVTGNFNINFYKISNCYSIIDTFSVTNDVAAYQPLQVLVDASLDATTYSAFHETQTGVGYVPPKFKDQYYSADTAVALTIRDNNNNVVNTQSQPLTLYMSTSQRVEFTWTPTLNGSYTATVATDVTDNQCSSSLQASSSKEFNVLPAGPTNECYTLLNDLFVRDPQSADDDVYTVNNQLIINYTKISNYADASSALTAVQTQAAYTITDSNRAAVFSSSLQLPANPDATSPTKQSFSWTPINPGWYDVNISGTALSALCTGLSNPQEKVSEHFYVRAVPTFSLNFQVADSTDGSMISGAAINVNGNTAATDTNGQATISGLPAGTYSYTITHPSYYTVTGTIQIVDVDMDIFLTMSPINRPPVITNIPDISMDEDTVYNLLDLDDYVIDSDNDDSELSWAAAGNANIAVSINSATHIATFTPALNWVGQETITFTATDPGLLSDLDTIIVTVDSVNDAPVIASLPDQNLNEDSPLFDSFNLNDYTSDTETPDSALIYSIAAVTDANCGVSIDANDNIDIQPTLNWYGSCAVTIQVSDSALTATDSFVVAVNSVNDAPVVAGLPDVTFQTGSSDSSIDLDYYAYDVEDADNLLAWGYAGNTNVNIAIGSNNIVTFTAVPGFTGSETITFTATDTNSATDSDSMVVSVTPVINNPPTITNIPDQTLNEDSGLNNDIIDLWAYASDVETPVSSLTFTITAETNTAVVDCAVDSSRYIDCTTQTNQNGYSDVTIQVSDGSLTSTDTLRVTVNSVNDAPVWAINIADTTQNEDFGTITYVADISTYVTDAEGDAITFSVAAENTAEVDCQITGNQLMLNSVANWNGIASCTIRASDGNGGTADDTFFIAVNAVNDAPIITPIIPNQIANEDSLPWTLDLSLYKTDIEDIASSGPPLTWSVSGVDPSLFALSINPATDIATFTLVPDANGNDVITFTLTDSNGAVDTQDITVTVTPVSDNPVISITAPSEGETISGTYALTWTATDPDQSSSTLDIMIQYRYNGTSWITLEDAMNNNDGSFTWDTTAVSDANDYSLRIIATDDALNTANDSITQFAVDNPQAPNAAITAPSVGEIINGIYPVTWTATDLEQPSSTLDILLQYRCCGNAGWTNLFSSANNPGIYSWDTTTVPNSNDYELSVIATDDTSLTGTGYVSQFTIGPNSPTVNIITPVDGETINGTYAITWTATDPDQAVNTLDVLIEYRYNGTSWTNLFNSTNNPGIYSWDTTALSDATDYRLRITVTDDNGQSGIDTIGQFTVDNPSAPNAAINQPLQGAIWSGIKNVTWTATDLEQASSTLDILLQYRCCGNTAWTNLFSSANNPSYYTWNTSTVQNSNDYELRVIATDDSSLTGTGYRIQFAINNIQLPLPAAPRVPKPQNKIRIESINIPADFVKAGDDLVINLDFENSGDLDLDDVSATVVIPELGIRKKVGPFDVDKSTDASRAIILPIPEDAKPGEYTARITISNDKLKRVRHRPVIIK